MSRPFLHLPVLLLALGCGEDVPTIPPLPEDAGVECQSDDLDASTDRSCAGGEICVRGRCYAPCRTASDCSRNEACSGEGVCVRSASPRDSGVDAATDPCTGVSCEGTEVCHPVAGQCVQCLDKTTCGGGVPVCQLAFGECIPFNPRPCAPCDVELDCIDAIGGTNHGACVLSPKGDDFERVCVPSCAGDAGTCPAGLSCQDGLCVPRVGSCTGYISAVDARPCFDDTDCVPFGSLAADSQCQGAVVGDGGVAGVCRQPCGIAEDCAGIPATTCMGGFCVPMM